VLINKAVCDKSGFRSFHLGLTDSGCSSFLKTYLTSEESILVESITLDEFFQNRNEMIDLLKLDVEGVELEVLEGAQKMIAEGKIKSI
jgi:FkbM family methyltransferase